MRTSRITVAVTVAATALLTAGLVAASSGTATAATSVKIAPVAAPTPSTAYSPEAAVSGFATAMSGTPAIWAHARARDWRGGTPLTLALAKRIQPLVLPAWRAPARWSADGGDALGYVASQMGPIAVPVTTRKLGALWGGLPTCSSRTSTTARCSTVAVQTLGRASNGWRVNRTVAVDADLTRARGLWWVTGANVTQGLQYQP